VDDGSKESLLSKNPSLYLATHKINLGQGAALQTGIELARLLNPQHIVTMDADGQHSAKDIIKLVSHLKSSKSDIVFGKRTFSKNVPLIRKILIQVGIIFNWFYTGIRLSDAHNGFRILNKKAYQCINLKEPEMAHATEILELVKSESLTYSECSVDIVYTDYSLAKGQKNSNSLSIVKHLIFRRL
jgi:glycosyltransferase involved in cell wall biosynthesis